MQDFPTDLRAGADVFSSDGHKLGSLHRVVLNRTDLTVTHIVVDIGFLRSGRPLWEGGVGLDYDRIVPLAQVGNVTRDRVDLLLTAEEFKAAPEYTDEHFQPAQDLSPNEFDIADVVNRAQGFSSLVGGVSNVWVVSKLNKPLESVEIVEGTDVWRREPHQKVGDVKHVLLNPETGSVKALVVSRGFLFKKDVVLPIRYVSELMDDLIRVDLKDHELEQLREYEG